MKPQTSKPAVADRKDNGVEGKPQRGHCRGCELNGGGFCRCGCPKCVGAREQARKSAAFIQSGEIAAVGSVLTHSGDPNFRLIIVPGPPVAKPRQTRSDKWKQRPCVMRYREWADLARKCAGEIPAKPGHMDVKFFLPIPESWSAAKRAAHLGQPHQVKPDKDNLEKAAADALLKNDQCIWKGRQEKRWDDGRGPRVEITIY